jgi:hypothetical protein
MGSSTQIVNGFPDFLAGSNFHGFTASIADRSKMA